MDNKHSALSVSANTNEYHEEIQKLNKEKHLSFAYCSDSVLHKRFCEVHIL